MQNVLEKNSLRKSVKIFHFKDKNEKYIKIFFKYDADLVNSVKKISGVKWNKEKKFWYISNTLENLRSIYKNLKEENIYIDSTMFFNRFNEYKKSILKKYALKLDELNIKEKDEYINNFTSFINCFKDEDVSYLSPEEVDNYILTFNNKKELSSDNNNNNNNISSIANSINFYYENVLNKEEKFINNEEFEIIINNIDNIKHKIIFYLLFYTSFTKEELSNLSVFDYVEEEKAIYSEINKTKKFFIPEKVCILINQYIKDYRIQTYLFQGKNNNHLKPESIEILVNKKVKKIFPKKNISYKAFNTLFKNNLIQNLGEDIVKKYYENIDSLNKQQKQKIIKFINS
ncbi:MAG: hypothetical protein KatS3mg068_0977 [Candidatus Sericytochromatia bacterium]|nr:MAG: hypothetical protein KatS3mg068_0977 [Candidatus Sericytochromatia bacterium]